MEKIYEIIYNLSILISDISELSGNWMYKKKNVSGLCSDFFSRSFGFRGLPPGCRQEQFELFEHPFSKGGTMRTIQGCWISMDFIMILIWLVVWNRDINSG
jgi:hypothetical protein